jgi:nickel transport protein
MSAPPEAVSMGRVMRVCRFLVLAIAATVGALLTSARADAHAMHADVDLRADSCKLLAYFDEDLPAEFAEVTVTDGAGNVVLTGKTDERGVWTFPRPKPGRYTLKVTSVGHIARREFTVDGETGGTVSSDWRPNKWVGLGIGVGGLLGVSGASWLLRRRGRRLE